MNGQQRIDRILQWRSYMATMDNEKFFNLIRMYLGEVKTPFNKQKLIENLSAFLRREENQRNICRLLGKNDLKILSFVHLIPASDYAKIASFFSGENFGHSISDHLKNLEERLLIFTVDGGPEGETIMLNPLLEDSLTPFLGLEWLLDSGGRTKQTETEPFQLTPMFTASFISYVCRHPDLCKADGQLKKKVRADLVELYGSSMEEERLLPCLQKLLDGMCNLGLFESGDRGVFPDWARLEQFASLDYYTALIFTASSSVMHMTRQYLQKYSCVLINLFSLIPESGYTQRNLERLAFLIFEKNWDSTTEGSGRLEQILARHENPGLNGGEISARYILNSIVQNAVCLGLLRTAGTDGNGEPLYVPVKPEELECLPDENKKVVSVDTSLSVTIMPGLSLFQLLPFARMMDIRHYDVAAVYELNRHSLTRYFDGGAEPKDAVRTLNSFSAFPLPQNLEVILEEWYASYSSATLFCGYVLKLSEHNAEIAEKNPAISGHLKHRLAPGVYLLDSESDDEVQELMVRSGMEFAGKIRRESQRKALPSYPAIQSADKNRTFENPGNRVSAFEEKTAGTVLGMMQDSLCAMEMSEEQREGLSDRIERRIVVNPEQLRPSSVRFEKTEALAMDYSGKIHLVENAMQSRSPVMIEIEGLESPVSGIPLEIDKTAGNACVTLKCPDGNKKIPLGSAKSVKKIRKKLEY